jgi:hypothetical protein
VVLVGMHDHGTGLAPDSFRVVADSLLAGAAAGADLAKGCGSCARPAHSPNGCRDG